MKRTYTKELLDDAENPTGYNLGGGQIKASAELPDSVPTGRICPDCYRQQFKVGRFYICNANHAYNERGEKVG